MSTMAVVDEVELERSYIELLHYSAAQCTRYAHPVSEAPDVVNDAILELFKWCTNNEELPCPQIAFLKRTISRRVLDKQRTATNRRKLLSERVAANHDSPSAPALDLAQLTERIFESLINEVVESDDEDAWAYLQSIKDNPDGPRKERILESGLSVTEYEAAKKRVALLVKRLPKEIAECAHEALGNFEGKR